MKQRFQCLALMPVIVVSAVAQNNEVTTNNEPYFVISTALHPVTQNNYSYPPVTPDGYDIANVATGVVAGTKKWRVLPERHHLRLGARQVSGFDTVMRSAAATSGGQNSNAYQPAFELLSTVARTGGGLDPDFASPPLLQVPDAASAPVAVAFGMTVTVAPVSVTFRDVAMAQTYRGGENDDKDPNAGNGESQCMAADWQCGPLPYVSDGHFESAAGISYTTTPQFVHWCTYLEDEVVVRAYSNWGQRRIAPMTPVLRGHALGTYFSDLATNTAGGTLGFDVLGGAALAGDIAVPLLNVGAIWNVPIPFQGQTLEVNPGDVALPFLISVPGLSAVLGTNGNYQGPALTLPRLRGSAGSNLGVEYVVINTATLALRQTTGAIWIGL